MGQQDSDTMHAFESALRAVGAPRLRLDQVVSAYHAAFPSEAMRPDMRQRLRDQLLALVETGALVSADDTCNLVDDPICLPTAIVLSQAEMHEAFSVA